MGWMKQDEHGKHKNSFAAMASDMECHIEHSGRNVRCPQCRDELTKKQLWSNPVRVGEEPMALFKLMCPHCEAKLTIFND